MHPDGRAAGDPLRDRLVREDLALPAGDGAEQRDPVADLLASVAAIPPGFRLGEADERVCVAARDLGPHPGARRPAAAAPRRGWAVRGPRRGVCRGGQCGGGGFWGWVRPRTARGDRGARGWAAEGARGSRRTAGPAARASTPRAVP